MAKAHQGSPFGCTHYDNGAGTRTAACRLATTFLTVLFTSSSTPRLPLGQATEDVLATSASFASLVAML